ncbi:CBS domain-containing protein [Clostridium vincentii]|uniref:Inosine-5'-monophosphate dehydrogenase n=1 Tax=Clostridium vincentii TaxID=52704 RepID=A0A2T0BKH7_9CLOT|nr:CBS domain-containing protein [Clostridium vincentii]PRR84359.1 Inosine-5'-monophosphate dehydrogenase [Clostridium vincentii]
MKIANIIKVPPHTINVNDTIDKALSLINSLNINGLPVIDDTKKLVGMIVKADIYRFMIAPGHYDSCPVEWVMSKSVIVAQSDEDILTVAKRLRENNILAMPVINKDDVIGIISTEDLLDYFITQ